MADEPVAREVGVELPAPTCPACGEEVARVENPDGSYSGEAHSKCFKSPSKSDLKAAEKAAAEQSVPRETGDEKEDTSG